MYGYIYAGDVEYSKDKAAVDIDEMIEALEAAKKDGITKFVGLSGNYRGPRYLKIHPCVEYEEEEEY